MLIQKIIQELQDIPEDKLAEIYDLIHYFRLGLGRESAESRTSGLVTGKIGDAFEEFETDPDDTPIEEVKASIRRALQQAKSGQTRPISELWQRIDAE